MTLKRKRPLRAKKRLAAKPVKPKLRKPLPKTNPKRRKKRFAVGFGSKDRVALVQSLPCVACGARPSEVAHVRSRAAGGTAADTVPLCKRCHRLQHEEGIVTFAECRNLNLAAWADWTEQVWQATRPRSRDE